MTRADRRDKIAALHRRRVRELGDAPDRSERVGAFAAAHERTAPPTDVDELARELQRDVLSRAAVAEPMRRW
jgi:hypothetical protein